MPDIKANARQMRHAMTPAEAVLWVILRSPPLDGWHFRRRVVFDALYIADFASHAGRLVVEADGESHDLTHERDAVRTAWFAKRGYRMVRFRNGEVFADRDAVWRSICELVPERLPPPRSRKGASRPPRNGEGV